MQKKSNFADRKGFKFIYIIKFNAKQKALKG